MGITTNLRKLLFLIITFSLLCGVAMAQDGYWFTRSDLPTARQEILPCALNGKIYVIGGWLNGSSITDLVEVYDPSTDTWSTTAPLPRPRHHCALAAIDGILYVVGGYINTTWPAWIPIDTVLAYDPNTDEWTPRAPMIQARGEHCVAVYDGKIYATGGNDEFGSVISMVEVYDPVADTWTQVAPMLTERHHHASVTIDSLVYVVGGRQGFWGGPYTMIVPVEAYSPASDTWYTITDIPSPRGGLAAAAKEGKMYVFGGEIPGIFNDVDEFDPVASSWRSLTPMLTPRHGTAAVVVEDTIYIIGGSRGTMMVTDDSNEGFVLGTCGDSDHDGYSDTDDASNTCPIDNCPNTFNPDQQDSDGDSVGDACDSCPFDDENDIDGDGFCVNEDNCPTVYNPLQLDTDNDTVGDSCDICQGFDDNIDENENGIPDGCEYVCGDANGDENVNIGDAVFMITYIFRGGPAPMPEEAGDANCDGSGNIGDAVYIINFIFKFGPAPCASC